ncbi:hypothetical protein Tco_0276341 [Tanacetum coccineum]
MNDRATPPPEEWVNPCYWLTTWRGTYSHKVQPIYETKYWAKSTCPTTLLPPKHHVQVGRPMKKRKRSKHEDELFVKDGVAPSRLRRKVEGLCILSCFQQEILQVVCVSFDVGKEISVRVWIWSTLILLIRDCMTRLVLPMEINAVNKKLMLPWKVSAANSSYYC